MTPRVGDTYAVPLGNGEFGAVRVLRISPSDATSLVAVTCWRSTTVPSLAAPELDRILVQWRGRYRGKLAIAWYTGEPPATFVLLGTIPPSAEELAIDSMGSYAGQWNMNMAQAVILENDPKSEVQSSWVQDSESMHDINCDQMSNVSSCDDDDFWKLIDRFDSTAKDRTESIRLIVDELSKLSEAEILGFHCVLRSKLGALQSEEYAREIGEYALDSAEGFSNDHFLDMRAAAIAKGRRFYESVIADPANMPKGDHCEQLTWIVGLALRRKSLHRNDILYEDL